MIFKEHRRMEHSTVRSHQPSDRAERPREGATISRRLRGDRRDQVLLDGDRRSTQHTKALRRHGESLATPVLARRDFRDEPLSDKPLNHDRNRALMRTCERRDVIDRCIGMLGDLLKREHLRAAQPRIAFADATDPQRLHDVPEGIERDAHIGWMGRPGVQGLRHDSTGTR
jgi:hypothetical protein